MCLIPSAVSIWPSWVKPDKENHSSCAISALRMLRNRRGFVFFDLHGDTMPFLLRLVAAEERRRGSISATT